MKLYIKNMECDCGKTIVQSEIEKIGFPCTNVGSAIVTMEKKITALQHSRFDSALKKNGCELFDERLYKELINNLKKAIIDLEVYSDVELKACFADFITLGVDNNFISINNLFSEIEGVAIDKYIIKPKIARVKKLLVLCMMISCLPQLMPGCNTDAQQN